jgi:O-antigen/teichoic acid export membrane protein
MRMPIKKRFLKHVLCYTVFSFLNKGISFLMVPFFTRYLTPEDYGIYALFLSAVIICEPLLTFSINDTILFAYYDHSRFAIGEYIGTFFLFCASMLILQISCLGVLIFVSWRNDTFLSFLLLAPFVAMSSVMVSVVGCMWQIKEKPVSYGIFNFYFVSLQLFFNVWATAFLRLGWQGLLYTQGIVALLTILSVLVLLKKNGWLCFCFDKEYLRFGFKLGLGFLPNLFAMKLNNSMGRFFISQKFNLTATGIYAMGQKLGSVVEIYNYSFFNAYRPWLLGKLMGDVRRDKKNIIFSVVLAWFSILFFAWGGSFCVYILSGMILGENFEKAVVYVFWSASAYALDGMFWVVAFFIYCTAKSWLISLLTVTATGLNALFTWQFLRMFGIIGVMYAPVLAWGIMLVFSVVIAINLWKGRL